MRRLERPSRRTPWAQHVGPVPHAAMPALLAAADIVLNCSRSEGGMANAVIEALALGRAVLAADIPGNRSLIEDGVTGLLFGSETRAGRAGGAPGRRPGACGGAWARRAGGSWPSRLAPAREIDGYLEAYARATGRSLA